MQLPRGIRAGLATIFAGLALAACDRGASAPPPEPTPAVAPAETPAAAAALDVYFFQAANCIYSAGTAPTLATFVANPANAGRINLIPVHKEERPDIFLQFGVTSTPVMIFTRGGTNEIVHIARGGAGDQEYLEGIVRAAEQSLAAPSPLLLLAQEQAQSAPTVSTPATQSQRTAAITAR